MKSKQTRPMAWRIKNWKQAEQSRREQLKKFIAKKARRKKDEAT